MVIVDQVAKTYNYSRSEFVRHALRKLIEEKDEDEISRKIQEKELTRI